MVRHQGVVHGQSSALPTQIAADEFAAAKDALESQYRLERCIQESNALLAQVSTKVCRLFAFANASPFDLDLRPKAWHNLCRCRRHRNMRIRVLRPAGSTHYIIYLSPLTPPIRHKSSNHSLWVRDVCVSLERRALGCTGSSKMPA